MADLGISHTQANYYGSVPTKKPASMRQKLHFALNATLFTAAFAFVAALVCGVIG
ncbi:hypothetical protein C9413_00345 [Rhizobium sp. SEMIA 4085]|uniref:Uncharacterized protein n=1 Tax=Rhizobium gallicum bv. gallicum R602sp TaxID=1041138 RepID=A0A0B4X580_9HYPH|nr:MULTISPECIES: hypothetical protein [Rhizobium]AJD43264.1 hypothetical protein RGR602_CH03967 [Rhizobium gallicum bv. gallicum R602sp]NNH27996.1 hypothetical protein [Rhizobium sp. SEMIA 4085]TDW20145.1 hypothetical protein EV128_12772 [Rhizobium azibense]